MGGLTINRTPEEEEVSGMKADRPLSITADRSRVVEEGAEDAAFLWVRKGKVIPSEEAKRYGLKYKNGKVVLKEMAKPEDKAVKKPESKAVKKPEPKAK